MSTYTRPEDYKLKAVPQRYQIVNETIPWSRWGMVVSTGVRSNEYLDPNLIISATYGKYANPHISLTRALLEEHRREIDRENRRIHGHTELSNT
jgi:hypothetical protein